MPVYEYRCQEHGVFERVLRISEHKSVMDCPQCSKPSQRFITPVMVVIPAHMTATGHMAYESPTSGRIITNARDRRNDLASSNCIEYDPEMKKDAERRRLEQEKALDSAVDETVEREFSTMTGEQIERLGAELERGADIAVERI